MTLTTDIERGLRASLGSWLNNDVGPYAFTVSQENLLKPMPWGPGPRKFKKPSVITNTSELLKSGRFEFSEEGGNLTFTIVYDAPHAEPIEYGTVPHYPPLEPLIAWFIKKRGLSPKAAEEAAQRTARAIYRNGSDPHPFLRPAIEQTNQKYG